jgi:hypothetical protein
LIKKGQNIVKNFDEILKNGVIRWTEKEKESLINHDPDDKNGVFKMGNLLIIVTTEHIEGAIVECISVSRPGNKKPSAEDIERIKELFWKTDEAKDISRLYVQSNVIHLHRKQVIHIV